MGAVDQAPPGIQSLNKEARVRLSTSFGPVNGHFRELFMTLFGGGKAALQFVEGDDPLEAGLEIIAGRRARSRDAVAALRAASRR